MTEATCRRELELEIPAETVQKAVERVAKEFARVARVPGFRPGKAPITLIRRRFADDIKSEVLQSLVPEQIEREKENYEALKPGEELSSMEAAFDRAEEDYRPGESKKTK